MDRTMDQFELQEGATVYGADGDNVYLTVAKDNALNSGCDQEPAFAAYNSTASGDSGWSDATAASGSGDETTRIQLHQEELVARERAVERGEVRIEKDVVAQAQVVETPVTGERVRVTRHAINRDATDADAAAFRDEVIDVPVHAGEAELGKRVRLIEEVEIGKEQV